MAVMFSTKNHHLKIWEHYSWFNLFSYHLYPSQQDSSHWRNHRREVHVKLLGSWGWSLATFFHFLYALMISDSLSLSVNWTECLTVGICWSWKPGESVLPLSSSWQCIAKETGFAVFHGLELRVCYLLFICLGAYKFSSLCLHSLHLQSPRTIVSGKSS